MNSHRLCLSLFLFLASFSISHAGPSLETKTFAPVEKAVQTLLQKHPAPEVLLVLDIDNTLLAMQGPLGSDQWFAWQTDLLQSPTHEMEQVSTSFTGLLAVYKELLEWGAMRPTDPRGPTIVKKLQKLGVTTMVLTSRGPEIRDVTHRELRKQGFDFSLQPPKPELKKPWLPTGVKPSLALSPKETRRFGLDAPRPVSYADGVFLTSGQHKGAMLRVLLHDLKLDSQYKAVIFVDDHKKHLERMRKAFKPFPTIDLTTFHFLGEKPQVEEFEKADKGPIHRDFQTFQKQRKTN